MESVYYENNYWLGAIIIWGVFSVIYKEDVDGDLVFNYNIINIVDVIKVIVFFIL